MHCVQFAAVTSLRVSSLFLTTAATAQCVTISNDAKRLQCYDRATKNSDIASSQKTIDASELALNVYDYIGKTVKIRNLVCNVTMGEYRFVCIPKDKSVRDINISFEKIPHSAKSLCNIRQSTKMMCSIDLFVKPVKVVQTYDSNTGSYRNTVYADGAYAGTP